MKKEKINYYSDLLNDDFAGTNIETKQTPENFKYVHKNIFYNIGEFIIYYLIAKPLVFLANKIYYHQKIYGKNKLKQCKKTGYFIYGNHTTAGGDAFTPNIISMKKNYIITSPDATSIKGIKTLVQMLGAIPLPSTFVGTKNYLNAIKYFISEKNRVISIYPEAHIWPYYTKIRPFISSSFRYPVELNKPIFTITTTYVKSRNKLRKRPAMRSYIDGPFYPDSTISLKESMQKLRDEAYQSMVDRSNSLKQYEYIKYIKK